MAGGYASDTTAPSPPSYSARYTSIVKHLLFSEAATSSLRLAQFVGKVKCVNCDNTNTGMARTQWSLVDRYTTTSQSYSQHHPHPHHHHHHPVGSWFKSHQIDKLVHTRSIINLIKQPIRVTEFDVTTSHRLRVYEYAYNNDSL